MTMSSRLRLIDAARGFSVISMVAFHYCYDLKFLAGMDMPWFAPPLQDIWRASISWLFLLIAGCMCSLSRNNFRRGLLYGGCALGVYVVTAVASLDVPISFGIIYCMAASTLLEALLQRLGMTPKGPVAATLFAIAFVVCLGIPHGYVGLPGAFVSLPSSWYAHDWLSWLGLPGPTFASGDYYPLLPYTLLYLTGASLGWWLKDRGYPPAFYEWGCRPLEFVGRHALPIYVLHQPLLLLLCGML